MTVRQPTAKSLCPRCLRRLPDCAFYKSSQYQPQCKKCKKEYERSRLQRNYTSEFDHKYLIHLEFTELRQHCTTQNISAEDIAKRCGFTSVQVSRMVRADQRKDVVVGTEIIELLWAAVLIETAERRKQGNVEVAEGT